MGCFLLLENIELIFFYQAEFQPQLTPAWTEIHGDAKQRQAVGQSLSVLNL